MLVVKSNFDNVMGVDYKWRLVQRVLIFWHAGCVSVSGHMQNTKQTNKQTLI